VKTLPLAPNAKRTGFTMIEVLFASAIVGGLVVALYAALGSSVPMLKAIQENEQVTQILSEKMDVVRLYNWTQITNRAQPFVPTSFIIGIEPWNTNSRAYYTGSISIVQAPITESYRSNLLQIIVTVDWVSNNRPQSQSMMTYVAKYGLQSYIMR
jgi:prepilin-type N-terminal cleavage/methylation domain-containing protein